MIFETPEERAFWKQIYASAMTRPQESRYEERAAAELCADEAVEELRKRVPATEPKPGESPQR